MKLDVLGGIENTSVSTQHAFLPVIEAIVNSIHATEDRFGSQVARKGRVEVRLRRAPQQHLPSVGKAPIENVTSVTVTDNGCGFTDENMLAFETANSRAKADRGGKGVGRFSWLVVFREAVVKSTFEHAGERHQRTFVFRRSGAGIEEFIEGGAPDRQWIQTIVKLDGVLLKYQAAMRKGLDVIAERIFEQCFDYFVLDRCPRILLVDEAADKQQKIVLNDRISELNIGETLDLSVGNHELSVRHVQQPHAAGRNHKAHLCANHREVMEFPLAQVSDLGTEPIQSTQGDPVAHHVFVKGSPLDENVDATRTRLDLPDGLPLFEHGEMLDLKVLREAIGTHVNEYLADTLAAERAANRKKIEKHIRSVQPEYRHLITHMPEQLDRVKWTDDSQQLDESLYRIQQAWEIEVRRRQAEVERQLESEDVEPDTVAEELYRVIAETNEAGQANLVRYVSKRRAVIKLMENLLGKAVLEDHVHRIVFPLRKTADEVAYDEHNLWLVDDSLSFYDFVASDKPLASSSQTRSSASQRPDILAFKTGDAPFHHIALVEFKRPERKDENPVEQIVKYAVLLRKGGAQDFKGRSLAGIPKSVRIDGYAVATLTRELEEKLRVGPGNMEKVEGDWRWFGSVPAENLSIEVLDFQAFVRRAEQRNRAFFNKLGLS